MKAGLSDFDSTSQDQVSRSSAELPDKSASLSLATSSQEDLSIRENFTGNVMIFIGQYLIFCPSSAGRNPPEGAESGRRVIVVLFSIGPSGDFSDGFLRLFEYFQQYNNSPAYRQRHTDTRTQPHYLYRDDGGDWRLGPELGVSSNDLLNRTSKK